MNKALPIVFDTATIDLFRKRLLNVPKYKFKFQDKAKDAAVLMPLCLVNNQPSVLFTVRNLHLRTHKGEISFPGGKADPEDPTLEHTALRETVEEVGVDRVEILGKYAPIPNYNGSLRVHPFVGLIREPLQPDNLPFNPDEVSSVFTLPLNYLIQPSNRELRAFRNSSHQYTVYQVPDTMSIPGGEREIWGLTSFILDGKRLSKDCS
ncbi:hypothetical protein DM01DRAFT_1340272 [Hesseltinella vesiculosa]|uniref:Nudix hydrolase domain-containing protein n=1 Tax=Hesseltinella vesiculosa TaxID=101127 RepID=A0A1X2G4R3_9FUNG|nr:hypothetical protein DM01DRAFT_1340272 [Hesseltinella vesiculosa]